MTVHTYNVIVPEPVKLMLNIISTSPHQVDVSSLCEPLELKLPSLITMCPHIYILSKLKQRTVLPWSGGGGGVKEVDRA